MNKEQIHKADRARFQVESGIDYSGNFFGAIHKQFASENKLIECQQYSNTDTQVSLLWVDDKIAAFVIEARTAFNHVEVVKGTASEKNAEQERIKYALEVLKEVNLPYPDNELLGRRVKNKINFLQKQLK